MGKSDFHCNVMSFKSGSNTKSTAIMLPKMTKSDNMIHIVDFAVLEHDGYTIYCGLCNDINIPMNSYLGDHPHCCIYDNCGYLMPHGLTIELPAYSKGDVIRWEFDPEKCIVNVYLNGILQEKDVMVKEGTDKEGGWYWLCCAHKGTKFEVRRVCTCD